MQSGVKFGFVVFREFEILTEDFFDGDLVGEAVGILEFEDFFTSDDFIMFRNFFKFFETLI